MKALLALACTAGLALVGPAYADCPYPPAPDKLPDGATATLEDMLAAQKADMQHVEAQKHNAAIDQEQAVADRFNEQVKVFKQRTADKKG